jgi:hypothetical protein
LSHGESKNQNVSDLQHKHLIQIFRRYLIQDPLVINAITQFKKSFWLDNELGNGDWFFILPDLFEFCCQLSPELLHLGGSNLSYQSFRKLLYQYPTNHIISADQGRFELVEDRGHVDRNIYVLTRQQKK